MSKPIIEIEHLSKCYRIGATREPYLSLRDELARKARRISSVYSRIVFKDPIQPSRNETDFWALNDVSFSVQEGEVVGIIGRNGAGKSTLLKILSQVTPPTQGRITMRGRVASLLEVGTGFHPELTGRENIFLNGAILGMRREEIRRKFDEIVAFAEVDKFLDTPVKRYSSGMYVRLAFAVAAHLEPEILIIDEVLAVGDTGFQKKCLGRMGEVAKQGRTVLFVSHNMQAIRLLCSRALLLVKGIVEADGEPTHVTSSYLDENNVVAGERTWPLEAAPGDDTLRLLSLKTMTFEGIVSSDFPSDKDVFVEMHLEIRSIHEALRVGFELLWRDGTVVFTSFHNDMDSSSWPDLSVGINRLRCRIPPGLLNKGRYSVAPKIGLHCIRWIVDEPPLLNFDVWVTHGDSRFWVATAPQPGVIRPLFSWSKI
jgi:lipopolysaccharide transport system ATP-binding protein